MAIAPGGRIEAADYNQFTTGTNSTNLNQVWATQYGQTALSTVSVGQPIAASPWAALTDVATKMAQHQGTSIPALPSPSAGGSVSALTSLSTSAPQLIQNRFNAAGVGITQLSTGPYAQQQGINNYRDWTVLQIPQSGIAGNISSIVVDSFGVYKYLFTNGDSLYGLTAGNVPILLANLGLSNAVDITFALTATAGPVYLVGGGLAVTEILRSNGTDLSQWFTWSKPSSGPTVTGLASMLGSSAVAVTSDGNILRSTNLLDWAFMSSPITRRLSSVVSTGSRYVAVTAPWTVNDPPVIISSSTGQIWSIVATLSSFLDGVSSQGFNRIRNISGILVAVGANRLIAVSADGGTTWSATRLPLVNGLNYNITDVTGSTDKLILSAGQVTTTGQGSTTTGLALVVTNWSSNINNAQVQSTRVVDSAALTSIGENLGYPGDILAGGSKHFLARSGTAGTWTQSFITTITFDNTTKAEYFFNSGGLIKIAPSKTSSLFPFSDGVWNNLTTRCGTIYLAGSGTTRTIAGVTYNGTTQIGGVQPVSIASSVGWSNLSTSDQLIYEQRVPPDGFGVQRQSIKIFARRNGAQLTFTTTWTDSEGLSISGGTAPVGSTPGTAPSTIVSCISPSTTYLQNTWGPITLSSSLNPVPQSIQFEGPFLIEPNFVWRASAKNEPTGAIVWNGVTVASSISSGVTSLTVSGITYYLGQQQVAGGNFAVSRSFYGPTPF